MRIELGFGHVPIEPFDRHVALVRLAEELGFDLSWIADQTFYRDPYTLLTLLADQTDRIGLGLGVTNAYTRHPAMTARSIASVAEVAGGRTILGLGAGNRRELLDPLGLDAAGVAQRIKETALVVRALLTGAVVEYTGQYYQVDGVGLDFVPDHHVPIYVAGRGERVLEVAGEVADGVLIGGLCTPDGIGYAVEAVARGAARTGRDPAAIPKVSWVTCVVTDDADAARDRIRPTIAHIIGGAPNALFDHLAIPSAVIGTIKAAYTDGGKERAAPSVTRECIDAFSIIGSAAECRDRMLALGAAGITQLSALMPTGSVAEYEDRLRTLAAALRSDVTAGAL